MKAEDVMTSENLQTLHFDLPLRIAGEIMEWQSIRHVPVVDDHNHVVGLVTHRDLLRLAAGGNDGVPVRDVMTPIRKTFRPETPVKVIIETMITNKWGCVLIADEEGRLVGIITEADFLRVVYGML
ncbi:MAG: CBS domain-containing protein [Nitrospirota bacterium]|jgi:CBS-domain-containing membrane protein